MRNRSIISAIILTKDSKKTVKTLQERVFSAFSNFWQKCILRERRGMRAYIVFFLTIDLTKNETKFLHRSAFRLIFGQK